MASVARERTNPPREVLVAWLARLYRHGLTTTTGGNISLIDDDGSMYITPSGGDKASKKITEILL
jgi:L-fuculose-phosphate aldolase